MSSLYVELLPIIIGSAIGPGQILFSLFLLRSPERGLLKDLFYVAGITTVRLLQGLVFGFILSGAFVSVPDKGQHSAVTSTLLMVLGIILIITAYEQWQHEGQPEGPPPKWLSIIDKITPVMAFGIAFLMMITSPNLWFFTLSAIAVISEAQLALPDSIVTYLVFILLAQLLLIIPILIRIILPGRSQKLLDDMSQWLVTHNRMILMVLSLLLGVYFLVKGIGRLLAL